MCATPCPQVEGGETHESVACENSARADATGGELDGITPALVLVQGELSVDVIV